MKVSEQEPEHTLLPGPAEVSNCKRSRTLKNLESLLPQRVFAQLRSEGGGCA